MPRKKLPGVSALLDGPVSPSGGLSAHELCAILRSCRQNQVLELRFRGLEVTFATQGSDAQPPELQPRRVSTAKATKEVEAVEKHGLKEAELRLREEQLDLLAVEDPVAFEKFLLSEDAEQGSSTDDDL